MGWNVSLIIIEDKKQVSDNEIILALGFSDAELISEKKFEDVIYDNSLAIGRYNGNIVICDGYDITTNSLENAKNLQLTPSEIQLVKLFPDSEIVTVACVSAVNYHGYSVIKGKTKKRLKVVTPEHKTEFGQQIEEEKVIYQKSYQKNGVHYFKEDDSEYTEDELMEDFTFEIAKRRLGVRIDTEDGEQLLDAKFKVYSTKKAGHEKKFNWKFTFIIILVMLIYQIIIRLF